MGDTEFTHVTTRGHRRQTLFHQDADYRQFVSYLETAVERYRWRCLAYCIIPNHYHLLLETEPGTLGRGMLMLNGAYARYFNWRSTSDGHVFERKYHRETIERDEHLLESYRYLANNPVKAGLCARREDWPWSSYRPTAGLSAAPPWLDVDHARRLFEPYGGYAHFCNQIADELQSDCVG